LLKVKLAVTAPRTPIVTEFKFAGERFAVTVPAMVWLAGKLEMETTLPLTAEAILAMAFAPRLTTLWATICSPPVTTEESVVAVWFPSKTRSAIDFTFLVK
jgi:hypothetical protein